MYSRALLTLSIVAYLLIPGRLNSQTIVYSASSDSINITTRAFFTELGKIGFGKYRVLAPEYFKGKGVLLIERALASRLNIEFNNALAKMGPEGVYIRANNQSLVIVGNSALAIQHGVYIYLENLGFQYLMPGKIWENLPDISTIYKPFTLLTQPDFDLRTIANAHGYGGNRQVDEDFYNCASSNRLGGSYVARIGHSYYEIVSNNAETFKKHPEYFAQQVNKGTLPADPKFNVANKDLVQLVVQDAFYRVEELKRLKWNTSMISMEPSDGGGFCNTAACNAIGSPSDQVYYLTNIVARALQAKYPGIWVGNLAYNEHILPTKFKLEPNVFVMITNGFNRTKYSTTELLKMWGKKASKIGIYDYLSVYEWDNDLPGQVPVANVTAMSKALRQFYGSGAKTFIGESVMGWINRGPGQYVLSRLLWDINSDEEKIWHSFFDKAYGKAAPPIRKLYTSWRTYPHRVALENDMADWMAWVQEASTLAENDIIRKRIDQIKIYLHYVMLYRNLKKNNSEENMLQLLSFAYRNYESSAFATLPTLVSLPTYSGYQQMGWYAAPEQKWKADKSPWSSKEIQVAFQQDLQRIKKGPEVKKYDQDQNFVKLSTITSIPNRKFYTSNHTFWEKTEYIIRIDKKGATNYLEIYNGMAANPPDEQNVEINIYNISNKEKSDDEKPVLVIQQEKKGVKEVFSLKTLEPGYYQVFVNDKKKMNVLSFSAAIDYSIVVNANQKLLTTSSAGLNIFYFYVPKGVKNFRVIKTVSLVLESPTRRLLNYENNKEEVIEVEVLPGEEGIWGIGNQAGSLYIEGVPPYLGQHPSRMVLPSYLSK